MTEEKTCYNCGNKNCHIFYAAVKQDVAEHQETYEYTEFDCVNHNKWKEMKVEEIRTDNTETLKNALERIKELEKENAELKKQCDILDKSLITSSNNNIKRQKIIDELKEKLEHRNCVDSSNHVSNIKLLKAKEIIKELIDDLDVIDGEQTRELKAVKQAEQFLKETENDR